MGDCSQSIEFHWCPFIGLKYLSQAENIKQQCEKALYICSQPDEAIYADSKIGKVICNFSKTATVNSRQSVLRSRPVTA